MSWQQLRTRLPALTLALLVLLLAAPLSTGDRGLWLSVAPTMALLAEAPAGGLPAEHSTVLPDRPARATTAAQHGGESSHHAVHQLASPASSHQDERAAPLLERHSVPLQPPFVTLAPPRAPPA